MAERWMSLWRGLNWPNRISLLRLVGVVPLVVLLLYQRQWPEARYPALAILLAMAGSDVLDGYLARCRGQITRLGRFLDPLADKLLIVTTVILLATQTASVKDYRLPHWIVVVVVGKDLWVVLGFVVALLFTGRMHVSPARAGKLCTVTQLAMVTAVLTAPDLDRLPGLPGTLLVRVLVWATAGASVLAMVSYTRVGLALLAQAERREADASAPAARDGQGPT